MHVVTPALAPFVDRLPVPQLLLAPSRAVAGIVGNHLLFCWPARHSRYALTLHAWEPLDAAVVMLRRMVASVPGS